MDKGKKIAYFSMEVGLKREIPTYSGGLGILAGDSLKAAADIGIPMVGVTLMYKKGNFKQMLDNNGWQSEKDVLWYPEHHMRRLDEHIDIEIYGQHVKLNPWIYEIKGAKSKIPLYFLDADLDSNPIYAREATNEVYGGDKEDKSKSNRIIQEAFLGIGGARLLERLGVKPLKYHLNEGHAAFLIPELINKKYSLEEIIKSCIFTTHTPVEAGLERFEYPVVENILRGFLPSNIKSFAGDHNLNMTHLALSCSGYANAVSKKHAQTASKMFDKKINYITNGVHSVTWASSPFKRLYDKYCRGWREDSGKLENIKDIPEIEIWRAHMLQKKDTIHHINILTGAELDPEIFTIGFAKRGAKYKRADLIFSDNKELVRIGKGRLQLIFSGKAHPHDDPGKILIKELVDNIRRVGSDVKCIYVEDYNMDLGRLLTSGCDIWLNTPLEPLEASGTSGMKAAVNCVPHFSTLDGWWCEGWIEGVTGWSIGKERNNHHSINTESDDAVAIRKEDSICLYNKLENLLLPTYYEGRADYPKKYVKVMKGTGYINAPKFSAHRMMKEYAEKAYQIEI